MKQFTLTLILLVITVTNNFAQSSWQKEQEEIIRNRIDEFVKDVNSSNAEGFVDAFSDLLYSEKSKNAIKLSVAERAKVYDIKYSIHLKEVKVDEKMAYEEGWYRSELIPKDGSEPVIQEFDFLDIWALESDGKWRIVKAMKKERPLNDYKLLSELGGEDAKIAGAYSTDKVKVEIKVTVSNQLVLIVNNGSPIKLIKNGSLAYKLEGVSGAELVFEIGSDGLATKAIMKQANGDVIANRM